MKVNHEIRARQVRLIDDEGKQVGLVAIRDAQSMAQEKGLDLVEMVATSQPPVCKIMDYGKYRYAQSKKEKENRKAQHQIKVKEVKVRPNIDSHDLKTKTRHAKDFLEDGHKVRVTCMYRGREMAHQEIGHRVFDQICEDLSDVMTVESPPKMMGRILSMVLMPSKKKP